MRGSSTAWLGLQNAGEPGHESGRRLTAEQFLRLKHFIEKELGIRMPEAKRLMLESRLVKRLRALNLSSFEEYIDLVFAEGQREAELLHMIDAVTTNKTDFFREADHFDFLRERVLPAVLDECVRARRPCRVWSAACSSGEEPYTLAMVLEEFRAEHEQFSYTLHGTDISTAVLERAARAVYPEDRAAPISETLRKRYLLRSKDRSARLVRVKAQLRNRVTFGRLNLMSDNYGFQNPFDVVFCRNVLIYFERPNQHRILRQLCRCLRPGGYLFLGHSETITGFDLPLTAVGPTVYRKTEA